MKYYNCIRKISFYRFKQAINKLMKNYSNTSKSTTLGLWYEKLWIGPFDDPGDSNIGNM